MSSSFLWSTFAGNTTRQTFVIIFPETPLPSPNQSSHLFFNIIILFFTCYQQDVIAVRRMCSAKPELLEHCAKFAAAPRMYAQLGYRAAWWLYTPLQYAAFHNKTSSVVEALLELSSDVNNMGVRHPLNLIATLQPLYRTARHGTARHSSIALPQSHASSCGYPWLFCCWTSVAPSIIHPSIHPSIPPPPPIHRRCKSRRCTLRARTTTWPSLRSCSTRGGTGASRQTST